MAKELTDDELNLRRKARRRLVGAVAFTLAVVVVLPMVLDSEPRPGVQDIDLRIPNPDKVGEFVPGVVASATATTSPAAPVAEAAASAPVTTSSAAPASAVPAAAVEAAKPAVSSKQAPAADKQPAAEKKSADKQPADKQAVDKQTPEKTAADKQPTASKEVKHPDSASTSKPAEVGSYVVQVGAYSSADAAKQELKKLKAWGFKAYTEKAGDKVRVRVGPYADRDKADKVKSLLEKHGLHPNVINAK